MAEYMFDEFKTRPSDFVDALNRSILTLTDILEEVKENKDLYEELKKFVIENATVRDLIKKKDSIWGWGCYQANKKNKSTAKYRLCFY